MDEIADRLSATFQAVFPDLPAEQLPSLRADEFESWDSVNHITLITVIEEQFGITIDPDDFETLTSWQAIEAYVRNRTRA